MFCLVYLFVRQPSVARPSAPAAVAVLAAGVAAAGGAGPPLGRETPHRCQSTRYRRVGLLAPRTGHRRATRRQSNTVRI